MARDSESPADGEYPPHGDPAIETLRVTRDEARAVLDNQIETLDHLDAKSAETLRLNIIILGVLLTLASVFAGSATTPAADRFANVSVGIGIFFTFLSFVFAFWTWTSTRKETGPRPSDFERVRSRGYSEAQWLSVLIRSYVRWIRLNEKENHRDSLTLFFSHVCLFMAFGYYAWGIVWGVVLGSGPSPWLYLSVVLLGITLPILVITPRLGPVERVRRRLGDAAHRSWGRWYE